MSKAPETAWLSVLVRIFRDRDYRAVAVALLFLGLSDGVITPYIALWVTSQLHGTTWQASFIFAPLGLLTVAAGSITSIYSDRVARRKGVIVGALLSNGAAVVGLAFARSYALAVILYAVMAFEPFAVLFALLRDIILRKEEGDSGGGSGAFITTLVRTIYSVGWLIGPALGGFLLGPLGYRGLFLISAGLILATVVWSWRQISERSADASGGVGDEESANGGAARRIGRPARSPLAPREAILLGSLFLIGLLLFSGDTGRLTFLSLYITENLRLPVSDVSWTFSVAVFAELLFLPLAGRLADRFGVSAILSLGIAVQVVYFSGMGWTRLYWVILLLQVLYAFVIATSQGVAILFAQRSLSSKRTGLSTSTYLVSRGPAPLLNSLLVGASFIGQRLDRLFDLFGVFAFGALVLVVLMVRRRPLRPSAG